MAGRRNKFAKRRREPSTPTSRKRSRRHCGSDFLQESALETPDKEVAVDQLTVSVRSLGIVDTPIDNRYTEVKSKKGCSTTADGQGFV